MGPLVVNMSTLILLMTTCANLSNVNDVQTVDIDNTNWNMEEIRGYHFHTYFFQNNVYDKMAALEFRKNIQKQIDSGYLAGCRIDRMNYKPRGPHPIGSFETCCNYTALSPATSWFMYNRGNRSVLLHPLTRYEIVDHTERAMWLGTRVPLDLTPLSDDLGFADSCYPIP